MTVTTVRPNSTAFFDGDFIEGAGPAHSDINDDSDSTGLKEEDGLPVNLQIGFPDPSIPAGDILTKIRLRARTLASLYGGSLYSINFSGNTLSNMSVVWTVATTSILGELSISELPADVTLNMWLQSYPPYAGDVEGYLHILEIYADVVHVEQPVVTVNAPSGTIDDTNRPEVSWTNTLDVDGGSQTHFEVKFFDAATYGGFGGVDPDVSTPYESSGEKASIATSWRPLDSSFANDDYRAYVRVAQTVNGEQFWSDWDYIEFTIDVPVPGVPTILATADNTFARILIEAEVGAGGEVSTDQFEIQRSTDGGETWEQIRTYLGDGLVANPLALPEDPGGDYLAATSFTNESGAITGDSLDVGGTWLGGGGGADFNAASGVATRTAGSDTNQGKIAYVDEIVAESFAATMKFRANAFGVTGMLVPSLMLRFIDNDNLLAVTPMPRISTVATALHIEKRVGGVSEYVAADNDIENLLAANTWYECRAVITSDGHVSAFVLNEAGDILGVVSGQDDDIAEGGPLDADNAGIRDGYFHSSSIPTRDYDDFAIWEISALPIYDYETGNGQETIYRARAIHEFASGETSVSDWSATDSAMWEGDDYWLKHPTRPSLNRIIILGSPAEEGVTRTGRQGTFQPLGSTEAIQVSDDRLAAAGTLKIRCDDQTAKDELDALLETHVPLLLQTKPNDGEPDRYLALSDHNRTRYRADHELFHNTWDKITWTEVARPEGKLAE